MKNGRKDLFELFINGLILSLFIQIMHMIVTMIMQSIVLSLPRI